jgi:hypothetical protein
VRRREFIAALGGRGGMACNVATGIVQTPRNKVSHAKVAHVAERHRWAGWVLGRGMAKFGPIKVVGRFAAGLLKGNAISKSLFVKTRSHVSAPSGDKRGQMQTCGAATYSVA